MEVISTPCAQLFCLHAFLRCLYLIPFHLRLRLLQFIRSIHPPRFDMHPISPPSPTPSYLPIKILPSSHTLRRPHRPTPPITHTTHTTPRLRHRRRNHTPLHRSRRHPRGAQIQTIRRRTTLPTLRTLRGRRRSMRITRPCRRGNGAWWRRSAGYA